jgi:alpha-L-fucosidase 2
LPKTWADGRVRGLCARGGYVVDVAWRQGRVVEARVLSKAGGTLRLLNPFSGREVKVSGADVSRLDFGQKILEIMTRPGQEIRFSAGL